MNVNYQNNIVIRPIANLILDVGSYSNTTTSINQTNGTTQGSIIMVLLENHHAYLLDVKMMYLLQLII